MACVPVSLSRRTATTGGSRLSLSKHLHKGLLELNQLRRSERVSRGFSARSRRSGGRALPVLPSS
jgi:hypothetical protein